MKHRKLLFWAVTLACLSACKETEIKQVNFPGQKWKDDFKGCAGVRRSLKDSLIAVQDEFKGLKEEELAFVMGRPDYQDLGSRQQKLYVYYIEPGQQCDGEADTSAERLFFKLSAMDIVTGIGFGKAR